MLNKRDDKFKCNIPAHQSQYEDSTEDSWTDDIENILANIRINCVLLSDYHKKEYSYLKGYLKYFRIPTIILAGINSVCSVGLQPYVEQTYISATTCFLSLVCGIITSIELYLSVQSSMENELMSSKDFHILALDIYKILSLTRENRLVRGQICLEEHFSQYEKLIENSSLIVKGELKDTVLNLEPIRRGYEEVFNSSPPNLNKNNSRRRDSILRVFTQNPRQAFKLQKQQSISNLLSHSGSVIPFTNVKLFSAPTNSTISSDNNKTNSSTCITPQNAHVVTKYNNNLEDTYVLNIPQKKPQFINP